jgi:hypothetical protein
VKGKKEIEFKREAAQKERENAKIMVSGKAQPKQNNKDITAAFDADDDEDVVF